MVEELTFLSWFTANRRCLLKVRRKQTEYLTMR